MALDLYRSIPHLNHCPPGRFLVFQFCFTTDTDNRGVVRGRSDQAVQRFGRDSLITR